jgi:hypothetical protein
MAGPGDEVAAGTGGHGPMRVSHAGREQVFIPFLRGRLVPGSATTLINRVTAG